MADSDNNTNLSTHTYWKTIQLKEGGDGTTYSVTLDAPSAQKIIDGDNELATIVLRNVKETKKGPTDCARACHQSTSSEQVTGLVRSVTTQQDNGLATIAMPTVDTVEGRHTSEKQQTTRINSVDVDATVVAQQAPETLRHEWTDGETRKIIECMTRYDKEMKQTKYKKPIWKKVALEMGISADKCKDKIKALKKGYRNYTQNCMKTGSSPSNYKWAEEMHAVMHGDPTVKPRYTCDSQLNETLTISSDENCTDTDVEIPKAKKRMSRGIMNKRLTEMTNYMKERDNNMLSFMKTMHSENKQILEKLIEKL